MHTHPPRALHALAWLRARATARSFSMAELDAFLADHELEHTSALLAEGGVTRVDELAALDASALSVLGLDGPTVEKLLRAVSENSAAAKPSFQWQHSSGRLAVDGLAAASGTSLPPPPKPPMVRSFSSRSSGTNLGSTPAARPHVWRRSVAGVWEETHETSPAAEASVASASGWEAIDTPEGSTYYYHAASGESSWERPAALDGDAHNGWVAMLTEDGRRYFYHAADGRSSWTAPAEWEEEARAAAVAAGAQPLPSALPVPPTLPTPPQLPVPQELDVPPTVPPSLESFMALSSSLVELPEPPMPPPPPPPDSASSAGWRRSTGEYLADCSAAQQLGLSPPPRPPTQALPTPPVVPTAWGQPVDAGMSALPEGEREFTVTVARNEYGLGLSFNDENECVFVDPRGGAAIEGSIRVGDLVIAIDGLALHDTPIRVAVGQMGQVTSSSTLLMHRYASSTAAAHHGPSTTQSKSPTGTVAALHGDKGHAAASTGEAGAKAGDSDGGWMELVLVLARPDSVGPLGLGLSDVNVVLLIKEGSAGEGILRLGDRILAVDGRELRGRKFIDVVRPQPTHTLRVIRVADANGKQNGKGGGHEGKTTRHASARPRIAHGWFHVGHRRRHHHEGDHDPFGLSQASAPTWFGPGRG